MSQKTKFITDKLSSVQEFKITSGALRVTDPCYDMETWCAGTLENVKNGTWKAHVGYWNDPFDLRMSLQWLEQEKKTHESTSKLLIEGFVEDGMTEQEAVKKLENSAWHGLSERRLAEKEKEISERDGRVVYIHITHEDNTVPFDTTLASFEESSIDVGVDSGQAGFFDNAQFAKVTSAKEDEKAFYDGVCDLTLAQDQFGVCGFGCVSSSGYGDGGYTMYFRKDESGQVIEAVILFIDNTDEEEDEPFAKCKESTT